MSWCEWRGRDEEWSWRWCKEGWEGKGWKVRDSNPLAESYCQNEWERFSVRKRERERERESFIESGLRDPPSGNVT